MIKLSHINSAKIILTILTLITLNSCKKDSAKDDDGGQDNYGSKTGIIATVTTIAGTGEAGAKNGDAKSATFNSPTDVVIDASGNIYVADQYNSLIRKISPAGMVTTFAGSGKYERKDGPSTEAGFRFPYSLAMDNSGNLYVADADRDTGAIRKITPSGSVSTLAKSGSTTATAFVGYGLCYNSTTGSLYGANGLYSILKISLTGGVSSFAGSTTYPAQTGSTDGTGSAARFLLPSGVTADAYGNIYVADLGNSLIRKISPVGLVTTIAGNGVDGYKDGKGTAAQFSGPSGIAVDALGNIYVADTGNDRIRKIDVQGNVTTIAGSGDGYDDPRKIGIDGVGSNATFNWPHGIQIDKNGDLIVVDWKDNKVRRITLRNK